MLNDNFLNRKHKFVNMYYFSQIAAGNFDAGIIHGDMNRDYAKIIDYTNFLYINEVIFSACQPKPQRGLYNILRPFE